MEELENYMWENVPQFDIEGGIFKCFIFEMNQIHNDLEELRKNENNKNILDLLRGIEGMLMLYQWHDL